MESPFPRQQDILRLLHNGAFIVYRPIAGKRFMHEYVMGGQRINLHGGSVRGLMTRKLIELKKIPGGEMLTLTASGKATARKESE